MKYAKAWIVTAVSYFVIDLIARGFILAPVFQSSTNGIIRSMSNVDKTPLMLEYVLMPTILIYILLQTPALKNPKSYAFKFGSILGLGIFGMYELVNSALLPRWTGVTVSVINAIGGATVLGLTTVAAVWALKKFNSK
ncbi:MAG TPA: DUF2177 family protein [Candidatus Saccharimonadales bacterium]|nr:DUF2177 family protein [Candidatus Saccharimonadales bacterium]